MLLKGMNEQMISQLLEVDLEFIKILESDLRSGDKKLL
jgi:hypothetical protein